MKAKLKSIFSAFIVLTLLFAVFAVVAFAKNNNDYSRPGYSSEIYNEIFTSVEFLRDKLGVNLGNAEREYLSENSDFLLSYPKNIPSSYVALEVEGGSISVKAKAYSYEYNADENISVVWKPKYVTCGSVTKDLLPISESEFVATFDFDAVAEGISFSVEYKTLIELSAEDVNKELSRAYLDAKYFEYLEKRLKYETELEVYEKYLSDKKIYDEKYDKYLHYVEDLKEYNKNLASYEEYLLALAKYDEDLALYQAYLDKAKEFEAEMAAYNEYLLKMEKVNSRLSILEDMKTEKTSLKRSVYSAIMGTMVDRVLADKDVLAGNVIGVSREALDGAENATYVIREFYNEYFSRETDAKKYLWYQTGYENFKNAIVRLYQCLSELYENDFVRNTIQAEDKSEKYEILLAQLYLAAKALSDGDIYDFDGVNISENHKINTMRGKKTPTEIIGDISDYFTDKNDATPKADEPYPSPVANPVPNAVPKPEKPQTVVKPTPPEEVSEPTAPAIVPKPEEPPCVENVNNSTAKAPFSEDSVESRLLLAYRNGELSLRQELYRTASLKIEPKISVTKIYSSNPDTVTVSYHDENKNHVGDVVTEKGSFAEIPHPNVPTDEKYNYAFETWVDENGEEVDLSCVIVEGDSILIYPRFKKEIKRFTVIWSLADSGVIEEVLEYGAIPSCPVTPYKTGDFNKQYEFSGFDTEIVPVTENAAYTAKFNETPTVPGCTVQKTSDKDELVVSCGAMLGEKIDVSRLLEISRGKYSLRFVFSMPQTLYTGADLAEFSLSFSEIFVMKSKSVNSLKFMILEEGDSECFFVSAYGGNGELLDTKFKLSAVIPSEKSGANMRLTHYQNGEKLYEKYTYSNGKISFNLSTGCHYSYLLELFPFGISSIQQEIRAVADRREAFPGESVSVSVNMPQGVELVSIYYLDECDERVIIQNGKFIMPDFDVRIGVEVKKIVYTVVFISDGKIISSQPYHYGDTVEIPEGVAKMSDGDYSYEFKGWSPSVTKVFADASYTAEYEKTPIAKENDDGFRISEGTLRIVVTAGVFAAVFCAGVIPSAVISTVLTVKRKKLGTALLTKRKRH